MPVVKPRDLPPSAALPMGNARTRTALESLAAWPRPAILCRAGPAVGQTAYDVELTLPENGRTVIVFSCLECARLAGGTVLVSARR
jgi:hypothetical protein